MASLYKRGKVWWSRISINGKDVRRPLSTNQRIAEEKLADLVKGRQADKYGHAFKDMPWDAFKERYLEWSKSSKSHHTYRTDKRALESLEASKLSEVSPPYLDKIQARWRQKRGVHIVNRDIRAIKTAMRKAEAWGLIEPQKWTSVASFKEPRGRLLYYSIEDIGKLLEVCHGVWRTILLLGARAGLRRSEIYWLAWEDVTDQIHICPKDGWHPKDYEQRWIPLSKDLAVYLRTLKRQGRWVLGDKRPGIESMTIYFSRLVENAGLKGSLHTLRHTFASHLVQAGVDLYTVAKLLGHNDPSVTQIYAHLAPKTMSAAIARLPTVPCFVPDKG